MSDFYGLLLGNNNMEQQFEIRDLRRKFNSLRPRIKYTIWERDGYVCSYCGDTVIDLSTVSDMAVDNNWSWEKYERTLKELYLSSASIDHKVPISKGGNNELENLTTSCIKCNTKKGSKYEKENNR